jgi:membrane protein
MATRGLWSFIRGVVASFARHRNTQAASAIAYGVLFAIVPMAGLLLAAFGFAMRDPGQRAWIVDLALQSLPLQSNAFVIEAIRGIASQSVALSAVGLVGIVWSASGLFGAIRDAFNVAWEVRTPRSFLMGKLVDVIAMVGLGLLLAASVGGTVAIHLWQAWSRTAPPSAALQVVTPIVGVAGLVLPAVVTFVSFMLLYRYVPNVRHCLRDVWMGALVATALFECGKLGFTFYVARVSPNQMYGAIGDVMLFMLWMWVSANILLIGAEVAAEHNRRTCGRPVEAKTPDGQPLPDDRDAARAHHA